MKAKKTNKKETPKAFAGLAVAAGLSAVPSIIAGYQGYKAQKEAAKEASDLKAMMPSLTTQEDYYNFYQKQAQALNEGKMQNQLDQAISAGAKTMEGAGTRGVLGGVQGVVSQAAQTKFDLEQQGQDKLLGAYEKMIQAKDVDRQRLTTLQQTAENQQAAGLQTMLSGASKSQGDGSTIGGTQAQRDFFGNPIKFKKGGEIEKTPGEFSHAKNPIDIVRDGSKIAEMTGGEYIFNPTQMKDIKGLVSKGSKEELHSYMKTLIKRFEKKAVK